MPLKLAVVGATGPTGLLIVEQALARGHQVVAIVRTPERLGELRNRPGVTVKLVPDVSVDSQDQLAEAFTGCQVVLSALGARPSYHRIDLMTIAVPNIAAAMRKAGINRLVVVTAQFTVYSPDHPTFIEWVIKPLLLGRNMDDFARAESHLVEHCTDLNFTVVKPPRLSNQPLEARETRACEGQFVPGARDSLPRANVAQFVLDCAEKQDMWPRKLVAIQF